MNPLRTTSVVALIFAAVIAPEHHARGENKITWASGFPKSSESVGKAISVKGTIELDAGFTLKQIDAYCWLDDRKATVFTLLKNVNWGQAELQLASGDTKYNVIVIATITSGGSDYIIITKHEAPKTSK